MRGRALRSCLLAAIVGAAALIAGTGAVPSAAQSTSDRAKLTKVRLQLKWVNQAQFAGYFVALDRGYYRQEGLDVEILPGGPEIAPESVVNAGGAEYGIDWLPALLVAREQGKPLVNIAQIFQASGMRLVTFNDTGIESVPEFAGKRVGVWFFGNEYQFYALMDKFKLAPPEQHMTVVSQPFEMTPFLNREIDVAHAMTYNELDFVYDEVPRSAVRVFDYNQLGVDVLEDGIFGEANWLLTHRQTTIKFLRASLRGWQWALDHPILAGKLSFRHADPSSPGGERHQIHMAQEVVPLIRARDWRKHPIGYMHPSRYERTWRTLVEEKVLAAKPKNAFTQDFLREATRGL